MKVFVATRQGQGDRRHDVFHGVEGELVRMPLGPCSKKRCPCHRSVTGLASSAPSTTFMAIENPALDPATYRQIFTEALEREGWIERGLSQEEVTDFIDWHVAAAQHYPADTTLRAYRAGNETRVESQAGCACPGPHGA